MVVVPQKSLDAISHTEPTDLKYGFELKYINFKELCNVPEGLESIVGVLNVRVDSTYDCGENLQ